MALMNRSSFEAQRRRAQDNLQALERQAGESGLAKDPVLQESLEELRTTLEQLRVADEELRAETDELEATQSQLVAERLRYRDLFELAPDAELVTDRRGTIRAANVAAGQSLNVAAAYLIGKPLVTFIPLDGRPAFRSLFKRVADSGQRVDWEARVQPRAGEPIEVAFTAAPILDAQGHAEGFRWVLRDITTRKRAEEEANALRADLEHRVAERTAELETVNRIKDDLLARVRLALDEAGASERRVTLLAEASRLLASSLDYEATLRTAAELATPELADWGLIVVNDELPIPPSEPDRAEEAASLARRRPRSRIVAATAEPARVEAVRALARQLPEELDRAEATEPSGNGEVEGAIGGPMGFDLASQALRAIARARQGGGPTVVSEPAEDARATMWPSGEEAGVSASAPGEGTRASADAEAARAPVTPPGHAECMPAQTNGVATETPSAGDNPRELMCALGVRAVLVVPLVVRGQTIGVMALFSGATGRRFSRLDLALAEQLGQRAGVAIDNAPLYQQSREALRARDSLMFAISHDLKNPLTIIKGYAQLLRRIGRSDPARNARLLDDTLVKIDATVGRMMAQIEELVDVTRNGPGEPPTLRRQAVDLVELARHAVAEYQQSSPDHEFRLASAEAELVAPLDAPRLGRALDNLLANAVKFSPVGTEVAVGLAREDREDGSWAILTVRDQGIGIPASDLTRVFDLFHRAANVEATVQGSGIGLASVRQIVELHGGTIAVESQEGRGTTFTLRLPLS